MIVKERGVMGECKRIVSIRQGRFHVQMSRRVPLKSDKSRVYRQGGWENVNESSIDLYISTNKRGDGIERLEE